MQFLRTSVHFCVFFSYVWVKEQNSAQHVVSCVTTVSNEMLFSVPFFWTRDLQIESEFSVNLTKLYQTPRITAFYYIYKVGKYWHD